MKKLKFILCLSFNVISIYIFFAFIFSSCKKTDTDKQWEKDILGYWVIIGVNGDKLENMPTFMFNEDNRGALYHNEQFENPYNFGWEIKSKQLKIYYDKVPPYNVGSNKYGSESLFKIKSIKNDVMEVIQLTYDGYQKEYDMKKTTVSKI